MQRLRIFSLDGVAANLLACFSNMWEHTG